MLMKDNIGIQGWFNIRKFICNLSKNQKKSRFGHLSIYPKNLGKYQF